MMSAAGTPSTDPWIILTRERTRYEEQFKSLKPINGVITGDQAKGFFLQSQLPPMILGQIWGLADTDADGKMDINEFSIACKLINLKLRGFEIPKGLPPSLLASLKSSTPPCALPLSSSVLVNVQSKPELPKMPPPVAQPLIPNLNPAPMSQAAKLANRTSSIGPASISTSTDIQAGIAPPPSNAISSMHGNVPPMSANKYPIQSTVPLMKTGVPPLQMGMMPMQSAISSLQGDVGPLQPGILPAHNIAPLQSVEQQVPIANITSSIPARIPPVQAGLPQVQTSISTLPKIPTQPTVGTGGFGVPLVPGIPPPSSTPLITPAPLVSAVPGMVSVAPVGGTLANSLVTSLPPDAASQFVTPAHMSPASPVSSQGPGATSTPRMSVASMDRTESLESLHAEWAVPHHVKLKYTQIFNTTDKSRTGYLSGAQARNVMVQTKLPQNILAQIWGLADMDLDGRLGCEEFVLAMYLCEQASLGNPIPAKLPPELIPPTFKRSARTTSVSSQGSTSGDQDPASTLLQTTFEDKRKENFEKGQVELDRRRKTLLDQQRKEAEERERKEKEEQDRIEKARQEAEKKRLEELERQMRDLQEQERMKEEERKRQAEQREAARREMERQRQLEWEKQRLQELQQQRQKEQENVLKLKARNQSLTIELSSVNDQIKELSQKICDTRIGVSNVKTTIDGMRSTRDFQVQEMSQLKNKLKEQNAKLLALTQEKVKLEAKNKLNNQMRGPEAEKARLAFENKELTIKNLKEKVEYVQNEIEGKLSDIENNNSQLTSLRTELTTLVSQCESLYSMYEDKRGKVNEMRNVNKKTDYGSAWKDNGAWNDEDTEPTATDWPVDNWSAPVTQPADTQNEDLQPQSPSVIRYRALYEFVARNNDEISFQPGDIINVPLEQTGEPGWLAGEIRGHSGWFPESYAEPVDSAIGETDLSSATEVIGGYVEETEAKRLEEIAEVPESNHDSTETTTIYATQPITNSETNELCEYYIANYPYQSQEQGDLTFNAGEIITVIKKDGDWWTGKIGSTFGIFPSNYVQKVDVNSGPATVSEPQLPETTMPPATMPPATMPPETTPPAAAAETTITQMDNEVSQINENKTVEKPLDSSITSSAQVLKSKKPEIASVIAPYQATSPEQLSLARGQLIMIRKKTDTGWWEGELQAKGRKRQVGWFPASYVKILNSSGRASGRSTPVSTTRIQQEIIIDKVVALYPYTAANSDELNFAKDDIISVTGREDEAWWRGELNGVSGLFPSNYVTPLQQQCKCKLQFTRPSTYKLSLILSIKYSITIIMCIVCFHCTLIYRVRRQESLLGVAQ